MKVKQLKRIVCWWRSYHRESPNIGRFCFDGGGWCSDCGKVKDGINHSDDVLPRRPLVIAMPSTRRNQMTERSYADRADSATDFDSEVQFDKDIEKSIAIERDKANLLYHLRRSIEPRFDQKDLVNALEQFIDAKISTAMKVSK